MGAPALRPGRACCSADARSFPVGAFETKSHARHRGPEIIASHRTRSGRPGPSRSDRLFRRENSLCLHLWRRPLSCSFRIDLAGQKALPDIDTGALNGSHGLAFAGGKVWFTAEGAKAVASYDPAAAKVDWIMSTGQNRTHMIYVTPDEKR